MVNSPMSYLKSRIRMKTWISVPIYYRIKNKMRMSLLSISRIVQMSKFTQQFTSEATISHLNSYSILDLIGYG